MKNNLIKKTPMTVEHHCLDLVYAPIRVPQQGKLNKLMASIEHHGQLVPVIIVEKSQQQWVLLDGYLRLKALRRLGKDTAIAEVWDCEIPQALFALLKNNQSRAWEALEEALLLKELQTQYGLSQDVIAKRIGRDRTWVCRRLSLIDQMPDFILQGILKGTVSLWAAQRVLTPVARATPAHGEKLINYLEKNQASTRELQSFYEHYQKSHYQERSKMVSEPDLFFKAQKLLHNEKEAKKLRQGPEGRWYSSFGFVNSNLKQIEQLIALVFYSHQEPQERHRLIQVYKEAETRFNLLAKALMEVVDDTHRNPSNDCRVAPEREKPQNH